MSIRYHSITSQVVFSNTIILPQFLVSAVICGEVARVDWLSTGALLLQPSLSRRRENLFLEITARDIFGAAFITGLQVKLNMNFSHYSCPWLSIKMNLRFK